MVEEDRYADIPLDRVVADELELRGTHGLQAYRYSALLEMVRTGTLAPERLVQRTLSLESLEEAGRALMDLGTSPSPGIQVVDEF